MCSRSGALRSEPNRLGDSPCTSPAVGGAPKYFQSCVCSGSSVWHHEQPSRMKIVLPLPAGDSALAPFISGSCTDQPVWPQSFCVSLACSVGGIWLIAVAPPTTVIAIDVKIVSTTSTAPTTYLGIVFSPSGGSRGNGQWLARRRLGLELLAVARRHDHVVEEDRLREDDQRTEDHAAHHVRVRGHHRLDVRDLVDLGGALHQARRGEHRPEAEEADRHHPEVQTSELLAVE